MIILLFFAFLSGLVTIFAPCIWPLLPIILSSTTTGEKHKPLGITLGIMLSFAIFTLSISYLVSLFHIDPDVLRIVAVIVIGFLGITLIIPALTLLLEGTVSRLSAKFGVKGSNSHGFLGGFITGISLGLVWSPCAGPILATIATLAATRAVNIEIVFVTIAYVFGIGIPLFIFATAGSYLFTRTRFLSKYTGRIQQVFGIVMLLTALAIYTNYDKILQVKLLDAFPSYATFLTQFESSNTVKKQLNKLKDMKEKTEKEMPHTGAILPNLGQAPEFAGIEKWLNVEKTPTMQSLRGKVVLVDFWTYTCINCIRTLPHVKAWYEKYKDQGLVVVGVHTPEFAFEKKTKNVQQAINQYGIPYPVAQDNEFGMWNAYNNNYWPAKYLIDAQGQIRYTHFGEGQYEETEKAIQELLKETGSTVSSDMISMNDETPQQRLSPETYVGSRRMEYLYPDGRTGNGKQILKEENPILNSFSLGGEWTIADEYSMSGKNAVIRYQFFANKVFLVMRPSMKGSSTVRVLLDGKIVTEKNQGTDVKNGMVTIDSDRLYHLIDLPGDTNKHLLQLEFQKEGTSVYAFTFG